jgi:hypothetical protein
MYPSIYKQATAVPKRHRVSLPLYYPHSEVPAHTAASTSTNFLYKIEHILTHNDTFLGSKCSTCQCMRNFVRSPVSVSVWEDSLSALISDRTPARLDLELVGCRMSFTRVEKSDATHVAWRIHSVDSRSPSKQASACSGDAHPLNTRHAVSSTLRFTSRTILPALAALEVGQKAASVFSFTGAGSQLWSDPRPFLFLHGRGLVPSSSFSLPFSLVPVAKWFLPLIPNMLEGR